MSKNTHSPQASRPDALDELVSSLLDAGAVLSQMIDGMAQFEASRRGEQRPDLVPIPQIAHDLIRSVAGPVVLGRTKQSIRAAAAIIEQITELIADNIFAVDPDWLDSISEEDDAEVGGTAPDAINPEVDEAIAEFVAELLSKGPMLRGLVENLAESLPPDAYPGEEPQAVVFEMMHGSIATALSSTEPSEIRSATQLIDLAAGRAIEHLRLAAELSRRMRGGWGERGRAFG